MASSTFKPCSTCETQNIAKPKLGIHPCHGCQKSFCLPHLTDHRHELSSALDAVTIQRDELFELVFSDKNTRNTALEKILQEIDEWEAKMHESVNQTAEKARARIREESVQHVTAMKTSYDTLTKELTEKRESDDFFEMDIEQLSAKLTRLKQDLDEYQYDFHLSDIDTWSPTINISKMFKSSASYLSSSPLLLSRNLISMQDRNCFCMAASNIHILAYVLSINRNENRLILYRTSDTIELCSTEIDTRLGYVCDIVYAETLGNHFLVVCRRAILIYDPQTMIYRIMNDVKTTDDHPLWSIAISSNTPDAFISLGSNGLIERWSTETHPKWNFVQRWSIKTLLQESDEGIRMIRTIDHKHQIAMAVLQHDMHWRIDIFDLNLQLIQRGQPSYVAYEQERPGFGCRLLLLTDGNEEESWLFTERKSRTLWHMNGSVTKQIDKNVNCVCLSINKEQQRHLAISYNDEPKRIEIFNL